MAERLKSWLFGILRVVEITMTVSDQNWFISDNMFIVNMRKGWKLYRSRWREIITATGLKYCPAKRVPLYPQGVVVLAYQCGVSVKIIHEAIYLTILFQSEKVAYFYILQSQSDYTCRFWGLIFKRKTLNYFQYRGVSSVTVVSS